VCTSGDIYGFTMIMGRFLRGYEFRLDCFLIRCSSEIMFLTSSGTPKTPL